MPGNDSGLYEVPVNPDADGEEIQYQAIPSTGQKARGVAKMVGGTAVAVAGVPMLILPGPGTLVMAGGAALASKGHREFTGRDATPVEEQLDFASDKLGEMAKAGMGKAAASIDEKTPDQVKSAASAVSSAAGSVARTVKARGPEVGQSVGKFVENVAGTVADKAPVVGKKVGSFVGNAAGKVADRAPAVGKKVLDIADATARKASRAGKDAIDSIGKPKLGE